MEYVIGVLAVIVLFIIIVCIGYVKAPPDTAYMISGFRKPRILIGKAGIRIPFLERLGLTYQKSIDTTLCSIIITGSHLGRCLFFFLYESLG